jgi:hypothetical protein
VDKVFEQLGYVAAERIFGVQRDYRLATLEELSTEFPTHFALWSKENDAFGRPQLVLRMMERAADFSGRRSFDARKFETALGKTGQGFYDAFVSLADALVQRDQGVLDAKLDPAFPQLDQGVAAAIMLRDDVRVEEVRSIDVADVDGNRTEQIEVVVSFDAIDPADARQRALLEFSGRSDGWRLRAVTARY